MLRIGICDDRKEMRFELRVKLERLLETRNIENEIYEFSLGDHLMQWYEKNSGRLDLLFLDIEMEGANGMETAKLLRQNDANLQMVFVTAHPDYVFDGYSVAALAYLMKPPASEMLNDIITRALEALKLNAEDVYLCRNSKGTYRLAKPSILYFTSEKRQVTCTTRNGSYTFYGKLGEVEREVGKGFIRIHQRYLINAVWVERVTADAVLLDGTSLPISRAYQKEALHRLTQVLLD